MPNVVNIVETEKDARLVKSSRLGGRYLPGSGVLYEKVDGESPSNTGEEDVHQRYTVEAFSIATFHNNIEAVIHKKINHENREEEGSEIPGASEETEGGYSNVNTVGNEEKKHALHVHGRQAMNSI